MKKDLFDEIQDSLNKCEKNFIYDSLGIVNSGPNTESKFRFWFNHFSQNHKKIKGDIYEFGVYQGASLISIALLAKRLGSDKHFWGFDTFSGFPQFSMEDNLESFSESNGFSKSQIEDVRLLFRIKNSNDYLERKNLTKSLAKVGDSGLFDDNNYEMVLDKINRLSLSNISLVKGDFSETIITHFKSKNRVVFSANIDCDLYKGYQICLPIVFKNLEKGGYINIDEYYSLKYPGAKIATDEFLKSNKDAILKQNDTASGEFKRYFLTK